MKKDNLQKLAIGALALIVVALGLTFIINLTNKPSSNSEKLFTQTTTDKINRIEISTNGTLNFAISKENSTWKINEFNADPEQVQSFLTSIANANLTSIASNNTANYPNFEIEDSKAQKVTLKYDGGEFSFFVGKLSVGISTYVRIQGKDPVYVADQSLKSFVTATIDSLKDRTISSIPIANVTSIKTPKQEIKLTDGKWKKGDKELATETVQPYLSDVANLRAVSIADSTKTAQVNQATSIFLVEITSSDSKTSSYQIFKVGEDYFAKKSGDQTVFAISSAQFENITKEF